LCDTYDAFRVTLSRLPLSDSRHHPVALIRWQIASEPPRLSANGDIPAAENPTPGRRRVSNPQ
jgi:hypothetical protein